MHLKWDMAEGQLIIFTMGNSESRSNSVSKGMIKGVLIVPYLATRALAKGLQSILPQSGININIDGERGLDWSERFSDTKVTKLEKLKSLARVDPSAGIIASKLVELMEITT